MNMLGNSDSEIGTLAAIGPFGAPPSSKYDRLIARAKEVPAATTIVAYPARRRRCAGRSKRPKPASSFRSWSGRRAKISAVARQHGLDIGRFQIVDVPDSEAAAAKAVELIREFKGELLMKGSLHTDELMREVASGKTGLRTARRISHVFIMDVPGYAETLFITDAAINIFPDLDAKRDIIQNAIDLFTQVGLGTPRVAILSAVETVTAKIPSTIDAAALCKMADRGQITGGLLDGPLAFDNAIDPEAARIKGIKSRGCRPGANPRRARSRGRQHVGQEPHIPGQGRLGRDRARRARADHSDLACGLGPRAHGVLRRRRALRPCAPGQRRAAGGVTGHGHDSGRQRWALRASNFRSSQRARTTECGG